LGDWIQVAVRPSSSFVVLRRPSSSFVVLLRRPSSSFFVVLRRRPSSSFVVIRRHSSSLCCRCCRCVSAVRCHSSFDVPRRRCVAILFPSFVVFHLSFAVLRRPSLFVVAVLPLCVRRSLSVIVALRFCSCSFRLPFFCLCRLVKCAVLRTLCCDQLW